MRQRSLFKDLYRNQGLSYRAEINSTDRLQAVLELDDALWTATGVNLEGLAFDRRFLELLDTDRNGRILCGEARQAVRWLIDCLLDPARAFSGLAEFRLRELRTDTAAGSAVRKAAERILGTMQACEQLGSCLDPDENGRLDFSALRYCRELLSERTVSLDGVILPRVPEDPELQAFLELVIATVDGVPHPSGHQGVNQAELAEFMGEAAARLAWLRQPESDPTILPLGAETAAAFGQWELIRPLLKRYFDLDAAVAVEPMVAAAVSERLQCAFRKAAEREGDGMHAAGLELLRDSPLALPTGNGRLEAGQVRNPEHQGLVGACLQTATRLLDAKLLDAQSAPSGKRKAGGRGSPVRTGLSREDFRQADECFNAYRTWLAAEPGQRLAAIPLDHLAWLSGQGLYDRASSLIAEKGAAALAAEDLLLVERLLHYLRDLVPFLNNFVVFPYLYEPERPAAFEAGAFVADGRRFAFSVRVKDPAVHKAAAKYSHLYVLYLEVLVSGGPSYLVATPVTSGSQGRLYKGKFGLFREPDGTERSARIVDILENPISVPETLAMPFRRAFKAISARLDELAKNAEDRLVKRATEKTDAALGAPQPSPQPATPAPAQTATHGASRTVKPGGIPGGTLGTLLAGGSIALAALGSSFAFISRTFAQMSSVAVLVTLGSLVLALLLPVLIAALTKLASRDLAPLLEASGLAMNRSIRLSRSQARQFTARPRYRPDRGRRKR